MLIFISFSVCRDIKMPSDIAQAIKKIHAQDTEEMKLTIFTLNNETPQ